jgi:hypothetical protein
VAGRWAALAAPAAACCRVSLKGVGNFWTASSTAPSTACARARRRNSAWSASTLGQQDGRDNARELGITERQPSGHRRSAYRHELRLRRTGPATARAARAACQGMRARRCVATRGLPRLSCGRGAATRHRSLRLPCRGGAGSQRRAVQRARQIALVVADAVRPCFAEGIARTGLGVPGPLTPARRSAGHASCGRT